MNILSRVLKKPMSFLGNKMGINITATVGIISSIASSATAFGMMDEMDDKGVVINSAFAISGAFMIGSHMAFTIVFSPDCLLPMIIGKIISGLLAIVMAMFIANKQDNMDKKSVCTQ